MIAPADPRLIRIALENLLANSLKFTSRKEQAVIELGCDRLQDEAVYYVRDNGTGFDMRHAGKLFEAFERLHSAREFEGAGTPNPP